MPNIGLEERLCEGSFLEKIAGGDPSYNTLTTASFRVTRKQIGHILNTGNLVGGPDVIPMVKMSINRTDKTF